MIFLRVNHLVSIVGSKIFICNSSFYKPAHSNPYNAHWGELCHPVNKKLEYISDPPLLACAVISVSAALDKPKILRVAFHECASICLFYMYNVESRSYKMILPSLSFLCHKGWEEKVVTVGNTLYCVDDTKLIAHNLEFDILLEASLFCLSFYNNVDCCRDSAIVHPEKERFYLLYCVINDHLQCIIVDVFHMPENKALGILVV